MTPYLEASRNPPTVRIRIVHRRRSNIPPLPLAGGPRAWCWPQLAFCRSGPRMCAAGESQWFVQASPTRTCLSMRRPPG